MTNPDDEAADRYWEAVDLLQEVIDSKKRGSKQDVLEELEENLDSQPPGGDVVALMRNKNTDTNNTTKR